ncbi:hypothetical protein ACHAW5_004680 [Stephanodiscus triporus]|uniref:Uncharacterized protein n=1 Tax=Stephanodiscus triporus TaxID=2934178 RepID=A0ABD3NU39_9STRA
MGQLKQHQLPHGTFFFAPHSYEVLGNESTFSHGHEHLLKSTFSSLLDDVVDIQKEKERCARYNFNITNETHPKRRRLFLGSLLADDSMEVLRVLGTEVYNIFHTVSFIESNTTQSLTPRKWKYYDPIDIPNSLITLHQLFGPKTRVSVDYYVSALKEKFGIYGLGVEDVQREGSSHRWALNGMREDDIGIISDADEVFTRDFLRAMQICDVPQFRPNQDCLNPKVIASTMVFESSPNCLTKDRRWFHPDAILGECVENVGDALLHLPGKREYKERHGMRLEGYGGKGNYSKYAAEGMTSNNSYPLWLPSDFRNQVGGVMFSGSDGSPTGYHFHNFFMSADEVRNKYFTYGHAIHDATKKPIWDLHEDIKLAFDCAHGDREKLLPFNASLSSVLPTYYLDDEAMVKRHQLWLSIVKEEEEYWSAKNQSS